MSKLAAEKGLARFSVELLAFGVPRLAVTNRLVPNGGAPQEAERSLARLAPELAAQWHPTRNGDRTPAIVTTGSKYDAWWRCPDCGNTWQARVHSRTRGHGCPACARRRNGRAHSSPKVGRSLAELDPDMAAQWHPTRNDGLTPNLVGLASNKRVWWLCGECQHEWQVQISTRTGGKRTGCPRCAARARSAPPRGRSLLDRFPATAAEWHPTRNGRTTPADVSYGASQRVWWLCSHCGNEWQAWVYNRVKGTGCPDCAQIARSQRGNRRVAPRTGSSVAAPATGASSTAEPSARVGDSFLKRYPDAAAEWHPTENGTLRPGAVGHSSNRRAWWSCRTCGHEWSAVINSRGRGGVGCPKCGRRRSGVANATPKSGKSLADRFPSVAAELHPTLNDGLAPESVAAMSRKRVWWLCSRCENVWEAEIYSRANGSGCKKCASRAAAKLYSTPKPGQSLAEKEPELAAQWHPTRNAPLLPSDVTANSGQKVWWQCDRGHAWEAMINNRTKAPGCPKCTLWGTSAEEIRLRHELIAAGVPIEAQQEVRHPATGKPLKCDMVAPVWNVVIEFDGNRFHKTAASLAKDARKTQLLTECGFTVIRVREKLPAIGANDVVVELFSSEVTRAKKVLQKLHDLGLKAPGYRQYMKTDEPWGSTAAGEHIKRYPERSLMTESPALAAEWDIVKNGDLSPSNVTTGSGRKVWWICSTCEHSWPAAVYTRARHGCPQCGRRRSTSIPNA
jgi:very-short-patch-repair endonuclease